MKVLDYLLDKFSLTKCQCFSLCPAKFFWRYVRKEKEPASWALLFGRAVHGGQEADNYAKLRGERLTVGQVLDASVAELEAEAEKEEMKTDIDVFAEEHRSQLVKFEESGARAKIRPAPGSVEARFAFELDIEDQKRPAVVEGFVDVVSVSDEGQRCVVDYKSAGRPVSEKEAEAHLQLGLEALGAEAAGGAVVTFVKAGKQKPTTKVTPMVAMTEEKKGRVLTYLANTITEIRDALKAGSFPKCSPTSFMCGAGCAYYRRCYPQQAVEKLVTVVKFSPVGTLPAEDWRMSLAGRNEMKGSEG
jgi:RecB family exonuclease